MIYIYIKLFLFWGISEALPYSCMSEKENNQPEYLPHTVKKTAIQLPSSYLSDWIMGPLQIWKSMSSPHQDHKRSHTLYSTRVSWGGFHLGIHPPGSPWIKKILTTSVRELLWCPISSCGAHHWKRTGAALLSLGNRHYCAQFSQSCQARNEVFISLPVLSAYMILHGPGI